MHFQDFDSLRGDDAKYQWVAEVTTAWCLRNRQPRTAGSSSASEQGRLASHEGRFDDVMERSREAARMERDKRQAIVNELSALSQVERAELFAPYTATSKELLSYVDRYNKEFTTDPVRMRPYFDACWASISRKFIAPQE